MPEEEATERAAAQAAVEDYLDRVCLPLVETLPYGSRVEMRREIAEHLRSLTQAYEEMGDPPARAAEKALVKFGDPETVSRLWRANPPSSRRRGKPEQVRRWLGRQWPGMAVTLSACGLLAALFATPRPAPAPPSSPSYTVAQVTDTRVTTGAFQHAVAVQTMECRACHRGPILAPLAERRVTIEQVRRWHVAPQSGD